MSNAMELLSTEVCDDILNVDLESRKIVIPDTVLNLGVESDDSVRVLHFQVPRYYCEVDLSTFVIRINYKHASGAGGYYDISTPTVEDNLIKFDWKVARQVVVKKGNVLFNVCFREFTGSTVTREFNTTVATLPVLEGLETGEELVKEHIDVFEQMLRDFSNGEWGGLSIPNGAKVGQIVQVSAVDENGVPTEWAAVDMPDGGSGAGVFVGDTAPFDTSLLWVDTSDNEGSTVDSVNGKTGTVVLTAADVGAMPADADVKYTLPVATAEKLGGIKVGEGLNISAEGVLSASGGNSSGGGGGVPSWSLLGEYDMSTLADTSSISLTGLDNLTHLYFKWEALQNGTSTDSNYWLSINGKQLHGCIANKKSGTSTYGYTICKWNGLVWEIQMSSGAIADNNYQMATANALLPFNHVFNVGECTALSVFSANATYKAVSGVLKIYGGK